eukprot:TRINITY_DN8622_c0_g1_i1.p1 TRINITY_DN8622_c0_g1~~TRINITY_DN8622_c0_g1_i1.p1  ORF type:complete len:637 (-),score=114.05 TRINITY_DN8622_c0_g1_i1:324-2234(-)
MLRKKLKESMITDKGNRRSPKRLKIAHKPAEMQSSGWVEPMTFHPTLAEFRDLPKYVAYMESKGAHLAGIAKIVPPSQWQPNSKPKDQRYNPSEMKFKIETPIQQTIKPTPTMGAFESTSMRMPEISIEKFVKLATSDRYVTPAHQSYEDLEAQYWSYDKLDRSDDPIYGADVPRSLIDNDQKIWNVGKKDPMFNTIGERLTRVKDGAYLYFGMWKATFSWHIEDMDLYGINFLHYGAPKTWYCVPPKHGYKLEKAAQSLFPEWGKHCYNFLRHKVCMISPRLLAQRGIKVQKMVQEERDIIIVFPHAYHSGFNHGFNIAEASNFGTPRWIDHGKRHRACTCSHADSAPKIDMEPFIEKYKPEDLKVWRNGTDAGPHPDDSKEIKEAWKVCKEILDKDVSEICTHKLGENIKMFEIPKAVTQNESKTESLEELTEEEKIKILKKNCKKQLEHFRHYREILPEIQEIVKFDGDVSICEVDLNDNVENKENIESVFSDQKPVKVNKQTLKKAERCNVQIKKSKSEYMQDYLDRLPKKTEMKSPKAKKQVSTEMVRKIGFADISAEELAAKRNMKKCWFKHKLWACQKCSGCIRSDCGKCIYCKDKPKFGGRGVQKQKCQFKKCSNPVVRGCDRCTWNL